MEGNLGIACSHHASPFKKFHPYLRGSRLKQPVDVPPNSQILMDCPRQPIFESRLDVLKAFPRHTIINLKTLRKPILALTCDSDSEVPDCHHIEASIVCRTVKSG